MSEPCKSCGAALEPTRNAALSQLCAICYERADDHLVLVRVVLPRWNVIQWYLCDGARYARDLVREQASAGTPSGQINAALARAQVRTVPMESVRGRVVRVTGGREMTIGQSAAEPWSLLGCAQRGETRMIGYELTGSRAREGM